MGKDSRIGMTMKELGDWKMRTGEEDWVLKKIYPDGNRQFKAKEGYVNAKEDGSRGYFDFQGNFENEDCTFAQEGDTGDFLDPHTKLSDDINHPSRYGGDTLYEAIKVILAWKLNFCLGNVVKYICRAGEKEGETLLKSLKKAQWYLNREIERLK